MVSDAFAWPMAASLLCAPVVYPWYLLWMLPFLRSASTVPIIIWTVSIIPTYYVWHLRTLGHPWLVPGWIVLLEYGAVAVAGAIIGLRRLTRPAVPECNVAIDRSWIPLEPFPHLIAAIRWLSPDSWGDFSIGFLQELPMSLAHSNETVALLPTSPEFAFRPANRAYAL